MCKERREIGTARSPVPVASPPLSHRSIPLGFRRVGQNFSLLFDFTKTLKINCSSLILGDIPRNIKSLIGSENDGRNCQHRYCSLLNTFGVLPNNRPTLLLQLTGLS